ncbi:stonustoxin subunit beta-like [Paramisgurnus dabryanus]|uniref:stonustoxin subunit beta-like n=1 Tax=Paramisgurnus dabryanus TaxID=90735 RepID=UPI0031F4608E
MVSLLLNPKQPYCIYIFAYLWLVTLSVINAKAMLQPKPDEIGTLNEETVRAPRAVSSEQKEIAALGRPLFPGMLYDLRRDTFISGVTLWDKKSLEENLHTHPQANTFTKFSSSDSVNSKSSLLDVSASLKTSFLGGLVEVGGSAKYLRDTKSSNKHSRVTMYYSETTRYEQLTMNHLGKITYPEVFDQKSATHVVVAVLYGAQAFMVFDRTFSEHEDKQKTEADLNAAVNNIPKLSAEGSTGFKMNLFEWIRARKITCTFYGDFRLNQNPTTYMEALEVYKELPTLLKDHPENAVPIKVWLYPLHLLNATAARLEKEISTSVAFSIEDIMEQMREAERTYNDLSENTLVNSFTDIKDRLHSFDKSFRNYKEVLLKAVGRVLPAIRGGEMEEKSLEDILKIHRSSPFDFDMLNQWLNDAKSELQILSSVIKSMEGIPVVESASLNSVLSNSKYLGVFCYTFTSLKYEDPYLSALKEFLNTDRFKEPYGEQNTVSVESVKKWFKDENNIETMNFNANILNSVAKPYEANNVHSIISAISDPDIPGSSIFVYKNGKLEGKEMQKTFRMMYDSYKANNGRK